MKKVVFAAVFLLPAMVLGQVTIRIHQDRAVVDEYTVNPGDENIYIARDDGGGYNIKGGEPEHGLIVAAPARPMISPREAVDVQIDELYPPHTWYETRYSTNLLTTRSK